MITKYDFVNRKAHFESVDRQHKWTTKLGLLPIHNGGKAYLFDMGGLLMERKISHVCMDDDIQAGRDLIASWPPFEEKQDLLDILDRALQVRQEERMYNLHSSLREVYGISVGTIISRGISCGKLVKHAGNITTKRVSDLIEFLLDKTPMLAELTFPSPKSERAAIRACQYHSSSKKYMSELTKMVKGMKSFDIFTAFRVASYVEKITSPRPSFQSERNHLGHALKKGGL